MMMRKFSNNNQMKLETVDMEKKYEEDFLKAKRTFGLYPVSPLDLLQMMQSYKGCTEANCHKFVLAQFLHQHMKMPLKLIGELSVTETFFDEHKKILYATCSTKADISIVCQYEKFLDSTANQDGETRVMYQYIPPQLYKRYKCLKDIERNFKESALARSRRWGGYNPVPGTKVRLGDELDLELVVHNGKSGRYEAHVYNEQEEAMLRQSPIEYNTLKFPHQVHGNSLSSLHFSAFTVNKAPTRSELKRARENCFDQRT